MVIIVLFLPCDRDASNNSKTLSPKGFLDEEEFQDAHKNTDKHGETKILCLIPERISLVFRMLFLSLGFVVEVRDVPMHYIL